MLIEAISLFALCFGITLTSRLVQRHLTDTETVDSLKEEVSELREKSKNADSESEQMEYLNRAFDLSMKRLKKTILPQFISSSVFLVFIPVIGYFYSGFVLLKFSSSFPVIGSQVGWFLSMLIFNLISSPIINKAIIGNVI